MSKNKILGAFLFLLNNCCVFAMQNPEDVKQLKDFRPSLNQDENICYDEGSMWGGSAPHNYSPEPDMFKVLAALAKRSANKEKVNEPKKED